LPTPPFPDATAKTRSTPGIFSGPFGSDFLFGFKSGGAFCEACAVSTIETSLTPSFLSATSDASLILEYSSASD
jgi:hypothetical protein